MKLLDEVTDLAFEDPRYRREAYMFVLQAIHWSQKQLPHRRHLTGEECTELFVAYARQEYGSMAPLVLREWGILESRDFGEVVYNLIRIDRMKRQDGDRIEDFDDVLDLDEALRDPEFIPGPLQSEDS